jgi:KUP system potassium uptake protein
VGRRTGAQTALVIGALGVVFGDIGASPLYTIQTAFNLHDPHPITATRESVFGIVSLIFWSVTIVVTVICVCSIEGVKVAAPQVYRPTGRPQYAID